MAVGARDVIHVVVVAVPAKAGVSLMTIQAEVVLYSDRRRNGRAEVGTGWRAFLATTYAAGVVARRTVAGLTLQLAVTEWTVRVRRHGMCAAEQCEGAVVFVT